ncbi:Probable diguanylate cyclase YdaM [Serratia quinivorans]|nr:Probable diguanylate cyclase YdaM [Serratia quinivorans]CAI1063709.1 Probable diguanylate cyclase YdaM [Serratia quinivorans]CAI1113304.1 Probable diguanylate cyclase YdaM [Serratia quinivorans]CAI1566617.1 Probable diguanylate cyclase YdaM [Serratia quinivorans]CAI2072634.1 Probable diguanylate cyclase YdaM [Serratia quinivorans]
MGKAMNARISDKHGLPAAIQLITLFLLAFLLSLLGIFTRPIGSLSLFWPVNAILLGLLLRKPAYARPAGWLAIYIGMIGADLANGESLSLAMWLNACNMSLIATGYGVMSLLPKSQRRMGKPQTILYMFTASLSSAAVASTLSILRNDSLYNNTAVIAWLAWFSEQFSTNLLLLPVLLAAPRLKQLLRMQINWQLRASMPLLALLFSLVFSVYIGGPGAIAFPIPALLWCAVRYQLFTVTLLTLLTGMTEISSISANLMLYETPNNHVAFLDTLMSARLGIAMLVMGPLILASSIAVNRKLMRRLEHSANHDFLTGVLARNALTRKAGELLEHKHKSKEAVSLLLIDIDHFKQINDTHGHLAGDQILASFAHIVRRELRHDQLFGRLGGEEFAIMLPRALAAQGVALAEHLRQLVQKADLHPTGKVPLNITISVGVASLGMNEVKSLEQLMNMADIALYRAKSQGRNRVESFNAVSGNSVGHIMFK